MIKQLKHIFTFSLILIVLSACTIGNSTTYSMEAVHNKFSKEVYIPEKLKSFDHLNGPVVKWFYGENKDHAEKLTVQYYRNDLNKTEKTYSELGSVVHNYFLEIEMEIRYKDSKLPYLVKLPTDTKPIKVKIEDTNVRIIERYNTIYAYYTYNNLEYLILGFMNASNQNKFSMRDQFITIIQQTLNK